MQQREPRSEVNQRIIQLSLNNDSIQTYKIINISRGGVCFESSAEEFELNETVKLTINLHDKSIHNAQARVCYRSKNTDKNASVYGLSILDNYINMDMIKSFSASEKS